MTAPCPRCQERTTQIDASVYAGDYHSPPREADYVPGRQCVECGARYVATRYGKQVRLGYTGSSWLPPRKDWTEPRV